MRGEIHQSDRLALIGRHARTGRRVAAQRIVKLHHALIEHFHQHFAGHQFGERGDADNRVELRAHVIAGARFAEASEHALIAINHDNRHAGGTAAVENMVGVTVDNI